jgi:hypothetical protein
MDKQQRMKMWTSHYITGACLVLFVFVFYYFFTEGLPWFWYDDVQVLEMAGDASFGKLLHALFSFTLPENVWGRPVLIAFSKICYFFFGNAPHYFRMVKLVIFLVTLGLMYGKWTKQGGNTVITTSLLLVFATFPSVVIVNTWTHESAAIELFFMMLAFYTFFFVLDREDNARGTRFFFGVLLLLLIISADKSKAMAKIIPCIFLTYLTVTRSRNYFLYAVSGLGLLAVIPYGVLLSGTTEYAGRGAHSQLLLAYLSQSWPFWVSVVMLWFLSSRKDFLKDRLALFCSIWLVFELLFILLYPSSEIRYLFTTLAATALWSSIVAAHLFGGIKSVHQRRSAMTLLVLTSALMFSYNVYWTYNFRAYRGGNMVLAAKKMDYAEKHFTNSLLLYSDFTIKYFGLDTNNLYVNMNPENSWGFKFDRFIQIRDGKVGVASPERYNNIILLDDSLRLPDSMIEATFDGRIQGSLFDRFQSMVDLRTGDASLYDIAVWTQEDTYPVRGSIYKIK